jgi:hypothetical protein
MLVAVNIVHSKGNVVHASPDQTIVFTVKYSLLNPSAALNNTSDISNTVTTHGIVNESGVLDKHTNATSQNPLTFMLQHA